MNYFLDEGWSFINANQISTLCRITDGIEQRKMGNSKTVTYRLAKPDAFYDYMSRSGLNQKHEAHIEKVLSPTRSLGPTNE